MAVTLKSTPAPSVAEPCAICAIVVGSVMLVMCPESSYVITGSVRFESSTGDACAAEARQRRHNESAGDSAHGVLRESMTGQVRGLEETSGLVKRLRAHQAKEEGLAGGNDAESWD